MRDVRVETGDGPRVVSVERMPRARWSQFLDLTDEDEQDAFLIVSCTDLPVSVLDDEAWPSDAVQDVLDACRDESAPRSLEWAMNRIDTDDRLAVELRLCQEMSLSHSQFTEWSERDQDLALASFIKASDRCPGCGGPAEAMKDPTKAKVQASTCLMCTEYQHIQREIPEEQRASTHLSVVPVRGES